jgi:hypothetical protein
MLLTFIISIVNFTVFFFLVLSQKTTLKNMQSEVRQIRNTIVNEIEDDGKGL